MTVLAATHRRWAMIIVGAATAFIACPFAQPVPGVGQQEGRTITPPRVDSASVQPPETTVRYCPGASALFSLQADILDENMTDRVDVRWFVDYDPTNDARRLIVHRDDFAPPPEDPAQMVRKIPVSYSFKPDDWTTSLSPTHVVELVVSNGFATEDGRAPAPGYETQVFRWIFLPSCTP